MGTLSGAKCDGRGGGGRCGGGVHLAPFSFLPFVALTRCVCIVAVSEGRVRGRCLCC
jgi:hypothetical protein